MEKIFQALFGASVTRAGGESGIEKPSTRAIHVKSGRVDKNMLANAREKRKSGLEMSRSAVSSQEKKSSGGLSLLRSIRSFFSGSSSGSKTAAKRASPAQAKPVEKSVVGAGSGSQIKRPFTIRLGNLPFETSNVQPAPDYPLTPSEKEGLYQLMQTSKKDLDRRFTNETDPAFRMNPKSCLAAVLYASGAEKPRGQFQSEFDRADGWKEFNQRRGAWSDLRCQDMDVHSRVLNPTTIDIRIHLCRMAAERATPGFLEKFDKAAKISQSVDGTVTHAVTMENYWDVVTAIQTLAWHELNGDLAH